MRLLPVLLLLAACSGDETKPSDDGEDTGPPASSDPDGDGYGDADCDNTSAAIHPGADEVCDGLDNDCDGEADDDPVDGGTWYVDGDGDGVGDAAIVSCDAPDGAVSEGGDCDDADGAVYPGADEACDDTVDKNCDGSVGFVDADGDGWAACLECDDEDATARPDGVELCDGVDNDCDGEIDVGASDLRTFYVDADGDGVGGEAVTACSAPADTVETGGDCDDDDATVRPGAVEDCADPIDRNCDGSVGYADADADGWAACEDCDDTDATARPDGTEVCDAANVDEDCSGAADDADAGVAASSLVTFHRDADADGYGDPAGATAEGCDAPVGYAADATDCAPLDPAIHPGATEVCDAADTDEDCSGEADDDDAGTDPSTWTDWYRDADADGYGASAGSVAFCDAPAGFVSAAGDCDDGDAVLNPGAAEVCNGADDDCDGLVDDADASVTGTSTWHADSDGDGYGAIGSSVSRCVQPSGYVADGADCDDGAAGTNPGATEVCDALDADEDCDGAADDDDTAPSGERTYYADGDGDGYGDAALSLAACELPVGYVTDATDCDDDAAGAHPGATEVCDAANVDEDCDGWADDADSGATGKTASYADADGDGYGTGAAASYCDAPTGRATRSGDCDDTSASVSPGAAEVCDAVDNDCDSAVDDADSSLSATATWYRDVDGDGYGGHTTRTTCTAPSGYVATGGDCNDASAAISPGDDEVCDTSGAVDEDCDGAVDDADASVTSTSTWYLDADGDGYGDAGSAVDACARPAGYVADATDCNDARAASNPGATESCNGVDDDCDGTVDDGVTRYYPDYDGDGYGDAADLGSCTSSTGWVTNSADCDELDDTVNPAATEVCGGADEDCDGLTDDDDASVDGTTYYLDADGDGYGDDDFTRVGCVLEADEVDEGGDCDDGDEGVNPDGTELFGDAIDEDCDGETYPEYDCTGYVVPGDYSTIASALSALASSGGTICLGARSYSESITIPYTTTGSITIKGVGPESTTISSVSYTGRSNTFRLSGVNITGGVYVTDMASGTSEWGATMYLSRAKVRSTTTHAIRVYTRYYGVSVSIDGVDASSTASGGAAVYFNDYDCYSGGTSAGVSVTDSYLHDSDYGAYLINEDGCADASLSLTRNTIANNGYGIYGDSPDYFDASMSASYNIIYDNSVAEHYDITGTGTVSHSSSYNTLYGNGTNYSGGAAMGTGYVTTNPLLDFDYTPPRLEAGSPARGAGSCGGDDFWGATRSGSCDRGAVESP